MIGAVCRIEQNAATMSFKKPGEIFLMLLLILTFKLNKLRDREGGILF